MRDQHNSHSVTPFQFKGDLSTPCSDSVAKCRKNKVFTLLQAGLSHPLSSWTLITPKNQLKKFVVKSCPSYGGCSSIRTISNQQLVELWLKHQLKSFIPIYNYLRLSWMIDSGFSWKRLTTKQCSFAYMTLPNLPTVILRRGCPTASKISRRSRFQAAEVPDFPGGNPFRFFSVSGWPSTSPGQQRLEHSSLLCMVHFHTLLAGGWICPVVGNGPY